MYSLYIHIPFCKSKCPYCSFVSYPKTDRLIPQYIDALDKEASLYVGARVRTVYIGGGTPTCLDCGQINDLTAVIRRRFNIDRNAEWTIEANPATFDPAKAESIKDLGYNRISLGIQSLDPKYLQLLGRPHSAQEGVSAFRILREAGFSNISLDLMFALPGQTAMELEDDLSALIALDSEHLSIYALSVGADSGFAGKGISAQDEDVQAERYILVCERMKKNGLRQYEVSNFAKPGRECRHNLAYWQGGEYIGLGCAAHSFLNWERFWNRRDLSAYIEELSLGQSPVEEREERSPHARLLEAVLFGLRLNAGVDIKALERGFGIMLGDEKHDAINGLISDGFLIRKKSSIAATMKGRLVLDAISSRLI